MDSLEFDLKAQVKLQELKLEQTTDFSIEESAYEQGVLHALQAILDLVKRMNLEQRSKTIGTE